MAHIAVKAVLAAEFVVVDVLLQFPVVAGDGLVRVEGGIAPIVLEVVGVDAQGFVVFCEVEWAEFGLVVEHVEILVELIVVD